jgi:hypothetical protein
VAVLVTDGEETCGGEPAAAMARLTKGGATVPVNIVGFAIDDSALATTFQHWSEIGNGAHFEARDAAELDRALSAALQPTYEVLDAKHQVVAGGVANGEPVQLLPGKYTVLPRGSKSGAKTVTVSEKKTTSVAL